MHNGNGDNVAIIWDSPVTGKKEKYTYRQLLDEVEVLAGVLQEEGVRRGDVVIIYSMCLVFTSLNLSSRVRCLHCDAVPMIPAALIGALAVARLGAIHAAVFGGFAAKSLAQRIEAARPRAILTASCGIEGAKGPIPYRPLVEGAIEASSFKPEKVLIWQRDQLRWNNPHKLDGQRNWNRLVKSARMRGIRAGPVPVKSTDGLYIIYTSGMFARPVLSCLPLTKQVPLGYPKESFEKQAAMQSGLVYRSNICSISTDPVTSCSALQILAG